MGLFTRLRRSSRAPTPLTPPPPPPLDLPSSSTNTYLAPPSLHLSTSRPRSPSGPPSPTSSVVSSKLAPWKRGKGKGKDADKGPGTGKTVAAPLTSPSRAPIPDRTPDGRSREESMGHGNPISIAHPDAGRSPVSPAPVSISPISAVPRSTAIPALESTTPVDLEPEIDPPSQRLASSGEWNKDGGILGRLNFELEPSSAGASTSNVDLTSSVRSSWLRPKAQAPAAEVGAVAGPEQTVAQTAAESHTGDEHEGAGPLRISNDGTSLAETGESVGLPEGALAISLGGKDKGKGKGKTVEHNEEVEQLESPNKTRFWRGKGVPKRRSSRALSVESELRPPSPIRKPSAPPSSSEPSAAPSRSATTAPIEPSPPRPPSQPRPALRRPSSSLFPNPFRSASRVSLPYADLEVQPSTDDGSFQLKGFRHIAGTSDTQGAGELESYLTHVKRESVVALDQIHTSVPAISPSTVTSPTSTTASPSVAIGYNTFSRPQKATLSRPPSVAGSLASMDEHLSASQRVSVAAFRKGIRRPSETFGSGAVSDAGHGADLDDDDVPLAVLGKGHPRQKSSVSVDDHHAQAQASEGPSSFASPEEVVRKTSPPLQPPTGGVKVHGHTRDGSGSGGFIVKSGWTSNASFSPPAGPNALPSAATKHRRAQSQGEYQPVFSSPDISRSSTPANILESHDVVSSPHDISPADGYFGATSPRFTQKPVKSPPAPLSELGPRLDFGHESASPDQPASVANARSAPPPVAALDLPTPRELPPAESELDLPLPPDQMPPSPDKLEHDLPSRPSSRGPVTFNQDSTASRQSKRRSLLDEPMRFFSGFLNPQSTEEDGFDPALIAASMRALTDSSDRRASSSSPELLIPEYKGDGSPATSPMDERERDRPRDTLKARLAAASAAKAATAAISVPSRPTLTRLSTTDTANSASDDHTTEHFKSPVSDSSTVSPFHPGPGPVLATATATATGLSRSSGSGLGQSDLHASPDGGQIRPAPVAQSIFVRPPRPRPRERLPSGSGDRKKPSWSSSEDESEGGGSEEEDTPPRKSVRPAASGSTLTSNTNTTIVPTDTALTFQSDVHPEAQSKTTGGSTSNGDESSSEEETLADVRTRASRSTLSVNKLMSPSPVISSVPLPTPPPPPSVSLSPRKNLSPIGVGGDSATSRSRPKNERTPSGTSVTPSSPKVSSPRSVRPLPVKSPNTLPPIKKEPPRSTASPASSQSALTGDSSVQQPVTPRDPVVSLPKHQRGTSHTRTESGDANADADVSLSSQSQQWNAQLSTSTSVVSFDPAVEERQRRLSQPAQSSAQQWPPQTFAGVAPQSNLNHLNPLDPRAALKRQWQAQYMEAAYRASEDAWERASSVGGGGTSSASHVGPLGGGMGMSPSFGPSYQLSPMAQWSPMSFGYPTAPQYGFGGGAGFGMPFQPFPGMGMGMGFPQGFAQSQAQLGGMGMGMGMGTGMYSYGTGAQSVFGGEFGPPAQTPFIGTQSLPYGGAAGMSEANHPQSHGHYHQQQYQHQHQYQQQHWSGASDRGHGSTDFGPANGHAPSQARVQPPTFSPGSRPRGLDTGRRSSQYALSSVAEERRSAGPSHTSTTPRAVAPSQSRMSLLSAMDISSSRYTQHQPPSSSASAYGGGGAGGGTARPSKMRSSTSPPSSWRMSSAEWEQYSASLGDFGGNGGGGGNGGTDGGSTSKANKSRSRPQPQFAN